MLKIYNLIHLKYEHILGTIVSAKSVWIPFLQWASVFGKKAKKNLWYYTLQEGLLTIRKENRSQRVRHD